ncbi:hypothetical protein A8A01_13445 [Ewingella americana]|uniref:hypothetical protein n=1 Tax=Rahnella victoriana TaxID=1510570 RepID=UPI000BB16BC1|nr:hypothetical protein [Rahnella victoriana]PBI79078.1 hypothetical protein A9993_04775 [Rahnella victoriana]PKB89599.1 hypothetical protein A8A01_13445 [Ewingella americana]
MKKLALFILLPILTTTAFASAPHWSDDLKRIETGKQAWLDKVPEMAATANVEQAIKLEDALSTALSKNTQGTLKTLRILDSQSWPHMIGSDIVCSVPVEQSGNLVESFYQKTRMALLDTDAGANCLWILEASYEEWKADNRRQKK